MMDDVPTEVAAIEVQLPRLPAAASNAAFSVVRLEGADIQDRQRVDQALGQAPGVSLFRRTSSITANPTTQGISLRSIAPSGAGRALVTLDGVPQNDPFGGWVIWSGLPPEGIDGLTLVRGGGAGPYGAGALTGVIELEERAREGVELNVQGGSLNTQRGALVAETNAPGVDVLMAVSGGRTDGFVPVRIGAGAADTKLEARDLSGALRFSGSFGDTLFSARISAYDEDRESGLVGANARAQGQAASLTLGRSPTPNSLGFRLQAWARSSDLQNRSVSVAAGRATTTPANDQYETPSDGYGLNAALRGGNSDREWEVGADVRSAEGETHELFRYMAGAFTRTRVAGGETFVGGAYAEGTLKRGDMLFTGGLRLDQWSNSNGVRIERDAVTNAITVNNAPVDRDGTVPTARAGVRRDFAGGAFIRGAAYAGFRPPTLNELHRPFRVGNDLTEANSGLKPERMYGIEGAVGYESENTKLSLTVFSNQLEDAIANVTVGVGPGIITGYPEAGFVPAGGVLRQRQNAGVIDAVGVEAEAEHRYNDSLRVRIAAAYTEAEIDGGATAPQLTGLRPAQAPRLTATAGVEWRPVDRLTLDARMRYEGMRFEDDQNLRRLSSGSVVDLRAGWRLNATTEIYLAGENLTDEKLETGETADGTSSFGPPRTVMLGLRLRR